MKSFLTLPLIIALFVSACKSEAPAAKEPKPDPEAQLQALRASKVKLLNKKLGLVKQLDKIVAHHKIDSSGEMNLILGEKQQAIIDLQTIRTTHPSLQKLNDELTFWQGNLRSARTTKRQFEIAQASQKITEITTKIHTLSRELPAMREAEDRITRSEKATSALRRSLAEKSPEGKALLEELKKIEAELTSPH